MKNLCIICMLIATISIGCNQTAEEKGLQEPTEITTIQEESDSLKDPAEDPVHTMADEMPEFPGGDSALLKYINENIKYPEDAIKEEQQGRVVVCFTVEKDGTFSDFEVVRGIFPSLDEEAVRVLREMPAWTPGKINDIPVRVRYTIPIKFKL